MNRRQKLLLLWIQQQVTLWGLTSGPQNHSLDRLQKIASLEM